ncbi:hypothetical protein DRN50_04615 [Thermococci archaeon]|nr:MAG: hypothetical protein DRN50_04615 [Thermococci archaeon]
MISQKSLYLKPDASFKETLDIGAKGEYYAKLMLDRAGHLVRYNGYGTSKTEIFDKSKNKRYRSPDIVCELCGKKFEVRSKTKDMIAMSSDLDPYPDDTYIIFPIFNKRGIIFRVHIVLLETLRENVNKAIKVQNRWGESYFKWSKKTISCLTLNGDVVSDVFRAGELLRKFGLGCDAPNYAIQNTRCVEGLARC